MKHYAILKFGPLTHIQQINNLMDSQIIYLFFAMPSMFNAHTEIVSGAKVADLLKCAFFNMGVDHSIQNSEGIEEIYYNYELRKIEAC